jgi:transposase
MSPCPSPTPRVPRRRRRRRPPRRDPLKQVAKDFGISESCLANWLRAADVEDGTRPGVTRDESAELRELRKRNRLLEQENEVLRKAAAYLAQGNLPGNSLPARP